MVIQNKKIVLSAYACEPGKGSEQSVGWNWAINLSKYYKIIVLTRFNNKDTIQNELIKNECENIHFIYFDVPLLANIKKYIPFGTQVYYFVWQLFVVFKLKAFLKRNQVDLVHHVTFNGILHSSFIGILNVPYVWGPIGGGQISPKILRSIFKNKKIFELIRTFLVKNIKYNPVFLYNCRKAKAIIVANDDTKNTIPKKYKHKIYSMLEAGIDDTIKSNNTIKNSNDEINILWVGSIEPHKAPILALESMKLAIQINDKLKLSILGIGSQKNEMEIFCKNAGLSKNVEFVGQVKYTDMPKYYNKSDIFLFTSIRDTSGNVLLEAMRAKLPCIALNHHGAKEILHEDCGIKINIDKKEKIVSDITQAILRLASNQFIRIQMGNNGYNRVMQEYSWNNKTRSMIKIYENVI